MKVADRLPLTGACHHYSKLEEVPWDIQKYWHQRNDIFEGYDDYDIQLTDEAWFGVTPERVATEIADHVDESAPDSKTTLIDLFAGAGGNAIAFAHKERWTRIIAIEKDAATLACAQHNAEAYDVGQHITWVHGDCFEYLDLLRNAPESLPEELRVDLSGAYVFGSPPWGGVTYSDHQVFDLRTMQPYGLDVLHEACKPSMHALYLPRTSDLRQLARLVPDGHKIEVVQYCMKGASKAMVAYYSGDDEWSSRTERP